MLTEVKKQLNQNLRGLHLPTIRQCYEEQGKLAENNSSTYEHYLHEVVELEVEARRQNRVVRYLRESKLPLEKSWDAFDRKRLPRKVDVQLDTLLEGSFVDRHENLLAFGNPGSGKTHLLCAIGQELVHRGHRVLFTTCSLLVQELLLAKRELRLARLLKRFAKFRPLIIDDIGYVQQDREEMEVLFTLLAERYERGSIILTSNLPFSKWEKIFKDPMTTAAAIDWLVHHSIILELNVASYRLEQSKKNNRRGDLTVWFDEEAIANWKADKTGKPGGQRVYSDMAIETGLVVRMVYKLAYRQTEGFLHSIALLLGLGIEIPDYSTLSRRSRLLRKKLRIPKAASNQPIHLMIDSTGLRIHVGTARKPPKQRAWRKLHIAVDRKTGTIVASELTASRARDATRVPALLTQIQAPLAWVAADSAYDKETVYKAIEAHSPGRRTRVVIPPQRNATLSQNSNTAMRERDRHIRAIERHGRREWYKLSGFTKRSMVENAVYRYKAIIGSEMRARTLARQRVEHRIGCEILNKMAALGMPDTYCAG